MAYHISRKNFDYEHVYCKNIKKLFSWEGEFSFTHGTNGCFLVRLRQQVAFAQAQIVCLLCITLAYYPIEFQLFSVV